MKRNKALEIVQELKYLQILRTIYRVIGPQEARRLLPHLIGMILVAFVEMGIVAAIVPFVQYVENPAKAAILHGIFPDALLADRSTGVMVLGFALLALLLLGNGMAASMVWFNIRFSLMQDYHLIRRFFRYYLRQPYSYFLHTNSANISNRLIQEVTLTVNQVLVQFLHVVSRGVVVIALVAFIFWKDPLLATGAGILLGGVYLLLFRFLSRINKKNGAIALEARAKTTRVITEVLAGIKEVKLARHEERYIHALSDVALIYAQRWARSMALSHVPRYLLEAVAFGGMIGVILYLNASAASQEWSLSGIAFYGFAAFRLLPAMQQVYSGLMQASHCWATTRSLEKEISDLIKHAEPLPDKQLRPIRFEQSFALKDICFRYSDEQPYLFNRFSMEIRANSTVGIKGKTGSGKSTLVDIMLGLLKPDSGSIILDGEELPYGKRESWQMQVGYVPQSIYLIDDTIRANIGFGDLGEREIDDQRVREAARLACIADFVDTLPDGYETTVGERGVRLSGGQRQRIGIARALYLRPAFLVLDEATSALDSETERKVMDGIRALTGKLTIVMIAHRLSTLEGCDFILDLDADKIEQVKGEGLS